jgi:hypothetical protein
MQEATITSNGELGVGSTYVQVASFLGRGIVPMIMTPNKAWQRGAGCSKWDHLKRR